MKKLKYIFCDLDRTLLNNAREISPVQAAYIRNFRARKGFCFGFASGRAMASLLPLTERAGLMDACDVLIYNNGVDIYDVQNATSIQMDMLEVEDIQKLLDLFQGYDFINMLFHNPEKVYALSEMGRIGDIIRMNGYTGYHNPLVESYSATARVSLIFDPERAEEIKKILEKIELPPHIESVWSDLDVVDLSRKGVSKAKAINTYISQFGDTMEQVMVFGDSANDMAMMKAAGVSVAMQNATEEVKANSDYVTEKSNDEDGVMHFLKTVEEWF